MPDRDPSDLRTYAPLDTLKAVADDIWIVDGPLIRFGFLGIRFPFPTRMTIVRTPGGLFLHSPTRLTPTLQTEVTRLGPVRWIVLYRGNSAFLFAGASRASVNSRPDADGAVMSVAQTMRGLKPAEYPLAEPYRITVVPYDGKT